MSKLIKTAIIDDHTVLCEALAKCLALENDIEIVNIFDSGEAYKEVAYQLDVDVLLVDLNLPGESGLQIIKWARRQFNDNLKIIVLTMHNSSEYVRRCMSAGARAYIVKDCGTDEIASAIRRVKNGGLYFSQSVADSALSFVLGEAQQLTDQELCVLAKIRSGMKNREMAEIMSLSTRTIETHRRNIKKKVGANSTAELVEYAINNGV